MYGTVANIRCKPGHMDEVVALMHEWERDAKPTAKGAITAYLYRLDRDADEAILSVVFEDRKSYEANADNPEQDKWYQRMREHLADDPAWHDGEIVYAG